jgi:WD40 repeat protein
MTGHRGKVQAVGFSPDGRLLASASTDGGVSLWNVTDPARPALTATLTIGRRRRKIPRCAVGFSPDGRLLAVSGTADGDGLVSLWDVTDPARPALTATLTIGRRRSASSMHAVAFRPDGRLLATGSAAGGVIVWDVADPAHPIRTATLTLGRGQEAFASAVEFSRDGRSLATANSGGSAMVWDISAPADPATSDSVIVHYGGFLRPQHPRVLAAGFSPGGRLLALSSHWSAPALDGGSFTPIVPPPVSEVGLWRVTERADPVRTATLSLRHVSNTSALIEDPLVYALGFSSDGWLLATASDGGVYLWDVADPSNPVCTAELTDHGQVRAVRFSPNGRLLASASDNGVTLWRRPDTRR